MIYTEELATPVMAFQLQLDHEQAADLVRASANQLAQTDKALRCERFSHVPTQLTLSGKGELHLEAIVQQLQSLTNTSIQVIERFTRYQECIATPTRKSISTISSNRENTIIATVELMHPTLLDDFASNVLQDKSPAEREQYLQNEYRWSIADAERIWALIPEDQPVNCLVNATKNVPNLELIRQMCVQFFADRCAEGFLTGDPIRGLKLTLTDATISSNPRGRSAGQINALMRDLIEGAECHSMPTLAQPVYTLRFSQLTEEQKLVIANLLKRRQAEVILGEARRPQTDLKKFQNVLTEQELVQLAQERRRLELVSEATRTKEDEVLAYLLVEESFGLAEELKALGWQPFKVVVTLLEWRPMLLPSSEDSPTRAIVNTIRKRKGMNVFSPQRLLSTAAKLI